MCMPRDHLESGVGFAAMIAKAVQRLTLIMKCQKVHPIEIGISIWFLFLWAQIVYNTQVSYRKSLTTSIPSSSEIRIGVEIIFSQGP